MKFYLHGNYNLKTIKLVKKFMRLLNILLRALKYLVIMFLFNY